MLTLGAGLATGIGGLISIAGTHLNRKVLCLALGFSAGVMIYISFVELLTDSFETLATELGGIGGWVSIAGFFGGIGFIALIDKLVPESENPHEFEGVEALEDEVSAAEIKHQKERGMMMRTGILSALAIGIHNFPEGMASFFSALSNPALGVSIAIAIAIHNIPEGISIAVPIRYATGNKKKAFLYALSSGLAEPVGATIGFLVLMPFISDTLMGVVFAVVAGIMVFISLDELLPAAEKSGEHHIAIWGLIAGMFVMAFSLQIM